MKLKLDANGNVVVQEVNGEKRPVYVRDDGTDIAFDAAGTMTSIANMRAENKTHREAKEAAQAALKTFEGITDPAKAIEALKTVSNLSDKKLVDAGEVEKIKTETIRSVEEKYKPVVERASKLEQRLRAEGLSGAFSRSPLITGEKAKVTLPADFMEARFGQNFEVDIETGKITGKFATGDKIYSRSNPGDLASFDEALDILIDAHPQKTAFLKGSGQSGSGAQGGQGGNGGSGGKTMSRAEWNRLPPAQQAATGRTHTITD
jgi:hypothetical protein